MSCLLVCFEDKIDDFESESINSCIRRLSEVTSNEYLIFQ